MSAILDIGAGAAPSENGNSNWAATAADGVTPDSNVRALYSSESPAPSARPFGPNTSARSLSTHAAEADELAARQRSDEADESRECGGDGDAPSPERSAESQRALHELEQKAQSIAKRTS